MGSFYVESSSFINELKEGKYTLLTENGIKNVVDYINKLEEQVINYENFIVSVIIIPKEWDNESGDYILCNMSKQRLYKELYVLRSDILKHIWEDNNGDI